jgi:hypothetical protein
MKYTHTHFFDEKNSQHIQEVDFTNRECNEAYDRK